MAFFSAPVYPHISPCSSGEGRVSPIARRSAQVSTRYFHFVSVLKIEPSLNTNLPKYSIFWYGGSCPRWSACCSYVFAAVRPSGVLSRPHHEIGLNLVTRLPRSVLYLRRVPTLYCLLCLPLHSFYRTTPLSDTLFIFLSLLPYLILFCLMPLQFHLRLGWSRWGGEARRPLGHFQLLKHVTDIRVNFLFLYRLL